MARFVIKLMYVRESIVTTNLLIFFFEKYVHKKIHIFNLNYMYKMSTDLVYIIFVE